MSNKLANFLSGIQRIETVQSEINGEVNVVRDLAWGTYLQVGGLTQSGGVLEGVWKASLKYVAGKQDFKPEQLLVIGLGGGTISKLAYKYWPEIKFVGVDIDPVMVDLGKQYLGLDDKKVEIHIDDGEKFVNKLVKNKKKYDLICVDTYVGSGYPKKFESQGFIDKTKKILNKKGYIIFNRLYYGEKKQIANKFEKLLEKNFSNVVRIYPQANVMFVCTI